ncbi:MAG: hypothetical protein JXD23_01060 [Spirochaetales bacterium]|nr:hypothetical protein [Spirochaetales bacterium]
MMRWKLRCAMRWKLRCVMRWKLRCVIPAHASRSDRRASCNERSEFPAASSENRARTRMALMGEKVLER